ncbi:DUF4126 domain-containing protein [Glutamicibacter sp. JC586]|uniref:DUF4126 domain-containing protein n=1 Tax=Glutamicibacter sp. JC586 TaxID=2590552 RepID=UPI00135C71A2|nr:DUF4126 domain-containing protein [Glutamicibacter sp. JC586]
MDPLTASLMAIGSGSAAGLRPYFTVLALGLAGLLIPDTAPDWLATTANQIPQSLSNPWVLGICAVLAIGEAGLDKIPFLNLSMETVSVWLRPIFGALVGVGLGANSSVEVAVLTGLLGGGSALSVSLGKSSVTAASNVVLEPLTQWVRSLIEDFGALVLVFAAVLLPVLAALLGILAIVIGFLLYRMFRRVYRSLKQSFGNVAQGRQTARNVREAQPETVQSPTAMQTLRQLAAHPENAD